MEWLTKQSLKNFKILTNKSCIKLALSLTRRKLITSNPRKEEIIKEKSAIKMVIISKRQSH